MDFAYTPKVEDLRRRVRAFMDELIVPRIRQWHDEVHASGVVNLPRVRRNAGRCDFRSEASRRILGLFREFAPGNEPCSKLFAIQ